MLPEKFTERMHEMLGDEYDFFEEAYNHEKYRALRMNTLKKDACVTKLPFNLKQIPWVKTGYYFSDEEGCGKHPLHEAGAYYIQ